MIILKLIVKNLCLLAQEWDQWLAAVNAELLSNCKLFRENSTPWNQSRDVEVASVGKRFVAKFVEIRPFGWVFPGTGGCLMRTSKSPHCAQFMHFC
jgi:hypothetical protein